MRSIPEVQTPFPSSSCFSFAHETFSLLPLLPSPSPTDCCGFSDRKVETFPPFLFLLSPPARACKGDLFLFPLSSFPHQMPGALAAAMA